MTWATLATVVALGMLAVATARLWWNTGRLKRATAAMESALAVPPARARRSTSTMTVLIEADASGALREIEKVAAAADGYEAVEIVSAIAPADRESGWHMEECDHDPAGWKHRQVYRNAWEQTVADRGPLPSLGLLEGDPSARRRTMAASDSWFRHLGYHIEDLAQYVHTPTDAELCEPSCVYPRARRLVERREERLARTVGRGVV